MIYIAMQIAIAALIAVSAYALTDAIRNAK